MTISNRVLLFAFSLVLACTAVTNDAHAASTPLAITSASTTQPQAISDNTYDHGWKWLFSVTVPEGETQLQMKFSDWTGTGGSIAATNAHYYSAQSTDATDSDHALSIPAADSYGDSFITIDPSRDLDATASGTQVQVVVEAKVPESAGSGSYTTTYGVKTTAPTPIVVPPPTVPGITVSVSSTSPATGTIPVYEAMHSEAHTVLGFTLSNDSGVDADTPSLAFAIATSSSLNIGNNLNSLIEKATLTIDGASYDGMLLNSSGRLEFIDIGVFLPAGEQMSGTVSLTFNQQEGNYASEGGPIHVSLLGDTDGAVGSIVTDTGDPMPSSGNAVGTDQTLVLSPNPAAQIEAVSTSASATRNQQTGATYGTYNVTFTVTAGDNDFYISRSNGSTTQAAAFTVLSNQASQGSSVSALTSTADIQNGYYIVHSGQTKQFTFSAVVTPTFAGFYKVRMISVSGSTDPLDPTTSVTLQADTSDYETDNLYLSSNILAT